MGCSKQKGLPGVRTMFQALVFSSHDTVPHCVGQVTVIPLQWTGLKSELRWQQTAGQP